MTKSRHHKEFVHQIPISSLVEMNQIQRLRQDAIYGFGGVVTDDRGPFSITVNNGAAYSWSNRPSNVISSGNLVIQIFYFNYISNFDSGYLRF
jgi:hypothetical protein